MGIVAWVCPRCYRQLEGADSACLGTLGAIHDAAVAVRVEFPLDLEYVAAVTVNTVKRHEPPPPPPPPRRAEPTYR